MFNYHVCIDISKSIKAYIADPHTSIKTNLQHFVSKSQKIYINDEYRSLSIRDVSLEN